MPPDAKTLHEDGLGFYDVTLFDCPPFVMFDGGDCPRARDIRIHKKFEPMSMKIWCQRAKDATSIFDIGAQVGVYSLAAAALRPDLPVHAFEPNPFAFSRLRLHRQINQMNIVEHFHALGSTGSVNYFSWDRKPGNPISSGTKIGAGDKNYQERAVAYVECFDRVVQRDSIPLGDHPLIKIDVEGYEVEVVTGFGSLIAEHKPDIILESFNKKACDVLTLMFYRLGYKFFFIDEEKMVIEQRACLEPADQRGQSFNQFLTVRP